MVLGWIFIARAPETKLLPRGDDLYIGAPVIGRVSGRLSLILSRLAAWLHPMAPPAM
jgi:hypothetical protein